MNTDTRPPVAAALPALVMALVLFVCPIIACACVGAVGR